MHHLIVTDVETGGLSALQNPVTEIGLIVLNGETLQEMERYSTFVAPYEGLRYDQVALNYTGITMEQINSGKQAHQVAVELHAIYNKYVNGKGKYKRKPILVGHNIQQFDLAFIERLFAIGKRDLYEVADQWVIDTMILARYKWGFKEKGFSLGECCQRIGNPIVDAHRAMADIEGNVHLLRYFLQTPLIGNGEQYVQKAGSAVSRVRDTFKF